MSLLSRLLSVATQYPNTPSLSDHAIGLQGKMGPEGEKNNGRGKLFGTS